VVSELFHADTDTDTDTYTYTETDRQTDRQTVMTKLIVPFPNFHNAPKNLSFVPYPLSMVPYDLYGNRYRLSKQNLADWY